MAYLRIMGAELGYIKGNELKSIADNAMMYADIFMKIIPTQVLFCPTIYNNFSNHSEREFKLTVDSFYQVVAKLMSSTDNEIFAHYIFMDNKFIMPTASGLPLTFALSGTFAPGAKGGIRMAPNMVNFPSFVLNPTSNLYQESQL